jgi:hypothetical protein
VSRFGRIEEGHSLLSVSRATLKVTALACLLAAAVLAYMVAHGSRPYGFEDPVRHWLKQSFSTRAWAYVAEILAAPAVCTAVIIALAVARVKGATSRLALYAVFGLTAFLTSEYVAKPLVQRSYHGELTFPSGNVTAVCATALAIWLALGPVIGKRARNGALVIGVAWVLLMSMAVIGALWHTPLDVLGSILLSVGIVTTGAAIFESAGNGRAGVGTPEEKPQTAGSSVSTHRGPPSSPVGDSLRISQRSGSQLGDS